jgi:hypothetical protein
MNYDPPRAERFTLWGELVVYGDRELIAKLLAHSP